MQMRGRRTRVKNQKRYVGLALFLAGTVLLFGVFTQRVQPLLKQLAQSKAESVTVRIVNDCMAELMAEEAVQYENLVNIGYNTQGEIAYVGTDMVKLNTFKSRISSKIQKQFDEYDFGTIGLPLGTIVGGDYFIGRGPSFRFKVDLSCLAECSFSNVFDDAGINQTRHQIMLQVTTTAFAVADWGRTTAKVTTNYMIAETVIVGKVPDYYTNVAQSQNPVDDINNYGYDIN
jgi:sporulation protein YunB